MANSGSRRDGIARCPSYVCYQTAMTAASGDKARLSHVAFKAKVMRCHKRTPTQRYHDCKNVEVFPKAG